MKSGHATAIALVLLLCSSAFAADVKRRGSGIIRQAQDGVRDATQAVSGLLEGGPIECVKQKQPIDCDLLDQCVWCIGSKLGTGCYPIGAAKLLPSKYFECDKDLSPPAQQQQQAANSQCDGKSESQCIYPTCVWCVSAAVPSACYTPDEAKKLPAAVFRCKTSPSVTGSEEEQP